jgi:hypothetical protein
MHKAVVPLIQVTYAMVSTPLSHQATHSDKLSLGCSSWSCVIEAFDSIWRSGLVS